MTDKKPPPCKYGNKLTLSVCAPLSIRFYVFINRRDFLRYHRSRNSRCFKKQCEECTMVCVRKFCFFSSGTNIFSAKVDTQTAQEINHQKWSFIQSQVDFIRQTRKSAFKIFITSRSTDRLGTVDQPTVSPGRKIRLNQLEQRIVRMSSV